MVSALSLPTFGEEAWEQLVESVSTLKELADTISKMKNHPHQEFYLEDLVMMQMISDFDSFTDNLPKSRKGASKKLAKAKKTIEKTRKLAVSPKLFSGIVNKTIEAQFGDAHAALRELGQNSIDSYEPSDVKKVIDFNLEDKDEYLLLTVKDSGCGMDAVEIVRDLLIPYNSAKEFDPNKIGEHGLGWFSTVDLSDFVQVTSRKKGQPYTVNSVVFNENFQNKSGKWKALVSLEPPKKQKGTTVVLAIPKSETKKHKIEALIYKFLGLVNEGDAQIFFNGERINQPSDLFIKSKETSVKIDGEKGPLTLAYSTVKNEKEDHPLCGLIDVSTGSIIYTQRGLYIKFDRNPFDSHTLHHKLLNSLLAMGVNFWVNIPRNVTLTKGRNDIIADHQLPVLDAMYDAFEDVFLEGILGDEKIMSNQSNPLINEIMNLFNKSYTSKLKSCSKKPYAVKRRLHAGAVTYTAKILEGLESAGSAIKNGLEYVVDRIKNRKSGLKKKIEIPKTLASAMAVGGIATAFGVGFVGAIYLAEWIRDNWGYDGLAYTAIGCMEALTLLACLPKAVKLKRGDFGELGNNIGVALSDLKKWLKRKTNLYVDIEKKRERKREKLKRKLARKRISLITSMNEFSNSILKKEIIPVHRCSKQLPEDISLTDVIEREFSRWEYRKSRTPYGIIYGMVEIAEPFYLTKEKVSIDKLVELYFTGKLKYSKKDDTDPSIKNGDYLIDYKNQFAKALIDKIEEIDTNIQEKYDVKVLEDYLNTIGRAAKAIAKGLYYLSGVAFIHLALTYHGYTKGGSFLDWYVDYKERRAEAKANKRRMRAAKRREKRQKKLTKTRKLKKHSDPDAVKKLILSYWAKTKGKITNWKRKIQNSPKRNWRYEFSLEGFKYFIEDAADFLYKTKNMITGKRDWYQKDVERVTQFFPEYKRYTDFMSVVSTLEKEISDILDMEPLEIVYSKKENKRDTLYYNKHKGHINLNSYTDLKPMMEGVKDKLLSNLTYGADAVNFELIEGILAMKTAQALREKGEKVKFNSKAFVEENIKLREKVLRKFANGSLDIDAIIKSNGCRAGYIPTRLYDMLSVSNYSLKRMSERHYHAAQNTKSCSHIQQSN